jgi:hypothetical protein
MMDAVAEIKRRAGILAMPDEVQDFLTRPPESDRPERWGGICIHGSRVDGGGPGVTIRHDSL